MQFGGSGGRDRRRLCSTTTPLLLRLLVAAIAMAAAEPAITFEVHGKVQGVFFRKHTQAEAMKLKLRGWCENTQQGTVRGEAHGDASALEKFAHWLRHTGSPKSRIDSADFAAVKKDAGALAKPFAIVK